MESNMMDLRPGIIVLSRDEDKSFDWLSDGWYTEGLRGTVLAEGMMNRAKHIIGQSVDVPDAIRQLEDEGFRVIRRD